MKRIEHEFRHPKGGIRRRVSASFSGGKTSAWMTLFLKENLDPNEHELVVTFANTGREHPKTLDFVKRCDEEFGFNTVWLEAVVHHGERKSCTHRIVNYETADRDGAVFEEVIKKYGIPNKHWNLCNREMKLRTMQSYLRSLGWSANTYSTAVGIRSDEVDRVSLPSIAAGVFYPCVDADIRKGDVRDFWASQPFNLEIPEHWGNCVACFKKSDRKLMTIAKELPDVFEWTRRIEETYRHAGAGDKPRNFFRGDVSTVDLLARAAAGGFEPFHDVHFSAPFDPDLDVGGGCGASCEIGADSTEWSDEPEEYEP